MFVGEMVVMRADKTNKEEEDTTVEDEIEDEYGVDVPVRPLSGCRLCCLSRCVRGVRPHDFAGGSMVGVIPTMEPTVKFTGSIGGHVGGL